MAEQSGDFGAARKAGVAGDGRSKLHARAGEDDHRSGVKPEMAEMLQGARITVRRPEDHHQDRDSKSASDLPRGLVDGAAHCEALVVKAGDGRGAQHGEGEPDA